jgi:hypothetical protein
MPAWQTFRFCGHREKEKGGKEKGKEGEGAQTYDLIRTSQTKDRNTVSQTRRITTQTPNTNNDAVRVP